MLAYPVLECSAFLHFASLVPGNSAMAMLSVFFDDSGTHAESQVAVAACFISDKPRWADFDEKWRVLLEDEQFTCFHMSDFLAREGEFKNWNDEKRERVFNRVLGIVDKCAWQGYATAVIKNDYDRAITGKLREKIGDRHYTFAVQGCIFYLQQFMHQKEADGIQYVFDRMTKGHGEIGDLFSDLVHDPAGDYFGIHEGGWSFQSKKRFLPLQSADILACEAYRYMRDHVIGKDRTKEPLFQSSVKVPILRPQFFDYDSLVEFASVVTPQYERVNWDAPRGAFFLPD